MTRRIYAAAGALFLMLVLPAPAEQPISQELLPRIDWADWQMLAAVLLVAGVMWWRVEVLARRKDDQNERMGNKFADSMDAAVKNQAKAMGDVGEKMADLGAAIQAGNLRLSKELMGVHGRVAIMAALLQAEGNLDHDDFERMSERILRSLK